MQEWYADVKYEGRSSMLDELISRTFLMQEGTKQVTHKGKHGTRLMKYQVNKSTRTACELIDHHLDLLLSIEKNSHTIKNTETEPPQVGAEISSVMASTYQRTFPMSKLLL